MTAEPCFFTRERKMNRDIVLGIIVLLGFGIGLVYSEMPYVPPSPVTSNQSVLVAQAEGSIEIDESSPQSCTAAIKKAVDVQSQNDGPSTSVATDKAEVLVSCFGAVLKQGGLPNQTTGKYDASHYTCTGRSGSATITEKNVT